MATAPSNNFDFQNFYSATITSDILSSTLTIPLSSAPTPTEGVLVINPDGATPEVIFYTSKGASSVTCPADGRGWDSSTPQSWLQGTTVIMAPVGYMFRMLKTGSLYDSYRTGWTNLGYTPATVTYNGNRSYDVVVSGVDLTSTVSPGMRLRTSRTEAAPTQCTSLNGTTQYWVKTTPNKLTFIDDFVVSAWIKVSSYAQGAIVSRFNGTSGWELRMEATGQILIVGFNAGGGNYSLATSYQSVPLNKWVHVTAQLDMSSFTASTTTSYVMFDGKDVPVSVTRGGTNPTALVQAGNLEIGSRNGGTLPFPGKIAQVAIFNAKVTQSTMQGYISQGLSGSETSLASAYSFNNSTSDLNTSTPNDLSAGAGSPTATNADSPFTVDANGTPGGTYDYAIVQKAVYSGGNTTLTVQVPEGCAIPTSGGVSAVAYSGVKAPFGMPTTNDRWEIILFINGNNDQSAPTATTIYNIKGLSLTAPVGYWVCEGWLGGLLSMSVAGTFLNVTLGISTSSSAMTSSKLTTRNSASGVSATEFSFYGNTVRDTLAFTTATTLYLLTTANWSGGTVSLVRQQASTITLTPSNL